MNVNGKIILYVKNFKREDGEVIKLLSTSVAFKNKDSKETQNRVFLNVSFPRDWNEKIMKLDEKKSYLVEVKEGFISAPKIGDRLILKVMNATILETYERKPLEDKKDDLPF